MNFWTSLSQHVTTIVDTTKSALASATAAVNTTNAAPSFDPTLRIDEVEIGSLVLKDCIDADLFPSFAVVLDSLSGHSSIGEKRFVGVSVKQVFELSMSERGGGWLFVQDAHPLDALAKLRFRKGDEKKSGLLMLELKSGATLKYLLRDPLPCVDAIRRQMNANGITGNVTRAVGNSSRFVEIKNAQEVFQRATEISANFGDQPNIELVREMMDIFRIATEKFAAANDLQFEQVQQFARSFLQRADVLGVLDAAAATEAPPHPSGKLSPKSEEIAPKTAVAAAVESSPAATRPAEAETRPSAVSPSPAEALQLLVSPSLEVPPSHRDSIRKLEQAFTYSFDEFDVDIADGGDGGDESSSSRTDKLADDLDHFLHHLDDELALLLAPCPNQPSPSSGDGGDPRSRSGDYHDILRELDLPDFEVEAAALSPV